jgi:hypothetical protein
MSYFAKCMMCGHICKVYTVLEEDITDQNLAEEGGGLLGCIKFTCYGKCDPLWEYHELYESTAFKIRMEYAVQERGEEEQ